MTCIQIHICKSLTISILKPMLTQLLFLILLLAIWDFFFFGKNSNGHVVYETSRAGCLIEHLLTEWHFRRENWQNINNALFTVQTRLLQLCPVHFSFRTKSVSHDGKLTELRATTKSPQRKLRLTVGETWDTTHPLKQLITAQMTNNWLDDGWWD